MAYSNYGKAAEADVRWLHTATWGRARAIGRSGHFWAWCWITFWAALLTALVVEFSAPTSLY